TYAAKKAEAGMTVAIMTIDGAYAGMLTVADTPRADARSSIELLKRLGVRHIVMLTGDNEDVARAVAAQLSIDDVRANMTPESKLATLDELVKSGANVAMVGDGINDAPALARAHVGIAMGGTGTAVAVEAANVIILTDELSRIAETIQIARRAVSVVSWDMGIWFTTNALGFVMVWVGWIGPALAAAYNFGTDFLPIANSGRLFRYRAEKDGVLQGK
ncbi:MAG TPA: HAD-IC family P-type ATPase, partial [Candidatus Paceibacterota bacterium]|nr:HAD-IC family P-type ATPase [Candidatus Paceibacterota bacterium]